ncbi:MAG TPA: DUF177 domain-containing protein [Clostridiales bacterium]|nr:DUF177 domain-containing protein [Clostridiales bacterium]
MKFNIPAKPVEAIDFEFETEAEQFLPDYVKPLRPASVKGKLTPKNDGYRAEGTIIYSFEYNCDLCAKTSKFSKTVNFDEDFTKQKNQQDAYGFEGDIIDITQLVIDTIVLSLPSRLICESDCKGLCPVCGTDKNNKECGCKIEQTASNPFEILKGIGGEK